MGHKLWLAAFVGLALLPAGGSGGGGGAGEDRRKAMDTVLIGLEAELRVLLQDHGPDHPKVKALKHRIDLLQAEAAQAEPALPKGLLVVLSKQNVSATLKDARLRALGGRTFVVGMEVEGPQITRPRFAGMVVWIPLNDIIQMVELKDGKQGP